MLLKKVLIALVFLFIIVDSFGQKIVYSVPEKDDSRRMDFEIIGKISGNILIYKKIRNNAYIAVYNNSMEQIAKEEQSYMPDDRLINVDFFPYPDFSYVMYQYQRKNVVHCEAVKIDGNGKKMSDIIVLDTSHIGASTSNKIYSAVTSDDKSKIMVFKINSRNKSRFIISTLLFDKNLGTSKRSRFVIPMDEHDDYLDQFYVDNDGDFCLNIAITSQCY